MADTNTSPPDQSNTIRQTPWYRRPLFIGITSFVVIGAVVGIILGVTLNDSQSTPPSSVTGSISDSIVGSSPASNEASDTSSRPSVPPSQDSSVSPSVSPSVNPTTEVPSTFPTTTPSFPPPTLFPSFPPSAYVPSFKPTTTTTSSSAPSNQPTTEENGEIVLGITSNNVDYYRCHPSSTSSDLQKQIVLLHGASFSKEIWLGAGILDQFCAGARTVVALDLSVSTGHQGLMEVLETLQQSNLVQLPIDMLVTPSASGFTIVDWIRTGNVEEMPIYLRTWVPVATGSLTTATDEQIESLVDHQINVLAIHGNDDMAGGRYSNRLGELADATVVELVGRHAVYLQSPDEFVQTILDY